MNTYDQFRQEHRIRMRCVRVDQNPHMQDSDNMDHWKCVLRSLKSGKSLTIYFSMGYAHNGQEPKIEDVLDCMASDATAEDMSFPDFCGEYGYDEDSRKAEATWKACRKEAAQLDRVFGRRALETLKYDTERL